MRPFRSWASVCRKSLVCARYRTLRTHLTAARRVCSRTFALTVLSSSLSLTSQFPFPPFDLWSRAVCGTRTRFARGRRSSYAYTRVYTPCTSQISTLREHTNKPSSHVCVYSIRPAYVYPLLVLLLVLLSIPLFLSRSDDLRSISLDLRFSQFNESLELLLNSHMRAKIFDSGKMNMGTIL